jgi:hypothetical protein
VFFNKKSKASMHVVILGGNQTTARAYKKIFSNLFIYADWTFETIPCISKSLRDLSDIFHQLYLADIVIGHYGAMKDCHWPDPEVKIFLKTRFESLEAYASEFVLPYKRLPYRDFQYDHEGNPVGFMKDETVQKISELIGEKL